MRWVAHPALMGETRSAYRKLVRRPEGKRPLERPRHGRIILKWILKEWVVCLYWIHLVQDRDQ